MEETLDKIMELARAAGDMILSSSPYIQKHKGSRENYSTNTDIEIQKFLKENLTAMIPGSGFMGEEDDVFELKNKKYLWIVDPIDGTVNFSRHIPVSAVSIALVEDGRTSMGVVYNPWMDEMYHAVRGGGAYLNGIRMKVSERPRENSLVSLAWSVYNKDWADMCFRISEKLHQDCEDLRRMGSAAYEMSMLARGSLEMFFEMRLYPWDYAVTSLLIEESGGYCESLDGPVNLYDHCTVIAANSKENLDYLKRTVLDCIGDFRISGSIWKKA